MGDIPIKPLARRAKRLREPFSVAPAGNTIPAARGVGLRTVNDASSSGILGPLEEQEFVPGEYYFQTSSDGLFVIEFGEFTDYRDARGTTVRFYHLDPNA